MGNSMTYNSVDLGGANYGFIITDNTFIRPPQPRVNRDALAQADGEAVQGSTFGARQGVVSGVVVATSYANLITQQNNINAALEAGQEGAKTTAFDALSGKQWQCRVLSVDYGAETAATIDLAITLLAPDPWPEATSATTTGDVGVDGSGTTSI